MAEENRDSFGSRIRSALADFESVPRQQVRLQKGNFKLRLQEFNERQRQQETVANKKKQLSEDLVSFDQFSRLSQLNQMVNDPVSSQSPEFLALRNQLENELRLNEGIKLDRLDLGGGRSAFALQREDGSVILPEDMMREGANVRNRIISNLVQLGNDRDVFELVSQRLSPQTGRGTALSVQDIGNATRVVFRDGSKVDIPKGARNEIVKVVDPGLGTRLLNVQTDEDGNKRVTEMPISEGEAVRLNGKKLREVKATPDPEAAKNIREKFPPEIFQEALQDPQTQQSLDDAINAENPINNLQSTQDIIDFAR